MSKIWFITGASSGLGAELAKAAIEHGDQAVATFRKAAQASDFTMANQGKGLGVLLDVTGPAQIDAAVQRALQHFGRIDVLVNNAGYGTIGAVEEFSMEEIRAQFETNFFGAVALTKAVLPLMREQKSGHILAISSAAGFKATGGFGIYNASKFALEGFNEALAQEVASLGIRHPQTAAYKAFTGLQVKIVAGKRRLFTAPLYRCTHIGFVRRFVFRKAYISIDSKKRITCCNACNGGIRSFQVGHHQLNKILKIDACSFVCCAMGIKPGLVVIFFQLYKKT